MSPRPKKPRHCDCPHRPAGMVMKPAGVPTRSLTKIVLEIDELEAMRLCDGEGLSQAEAGERMGISRGTVQRLVTCGRRKMVTAIIECSALVIETEEGEEQL